MGNTVVRNSSPARYQRWREKDILEAIGLYDKGMDWDRIAIRMGRTSGQTVRRTVSNYKRGVLKMTVEKNDRIREVYLREALSGMTFAEIARRHGRYRSVVWGMLARMGYDQEMIEEERKLRHETVSGHAASHSGERAA